MSLLSAELRCPTVGGVGCARLALRSPAAAMVLCGVALHSSGCGYPLYTVVAHVSYRCSDSLPLVWQVHLFNSVRCIPYCRPFANLMLACGGDPRWPCASPRLAACGTAGGSLDGFLGVDVWVDMRPEWSSFPPNMARACACAQQDSRAGQQRSQTDSRQDSLAAILQGSWSS